MKANVNPGEQALARLVEACQNHRGHSTSPIAQLIVHLYNSEYTQVDLGHLCRRVDREHFIDVLAVLAWYRGADRPGFIHEYLDDGERRIHALMSRFGIGPREVLDHLDENGRYIKEA